MMAFGENIILKQNLATASALDGAGCILPAGLGPPRTKLCNLKVLMLQLQKAAP